MKTFSLLTITIFLALSANFTHARIGETREQCIERYGPDTGLADKKITYDRATASHHRINGISIELHYLGGVAYKIIYMRANERKANELLSHHFSDTEIEGFMSKNLEVEMIRNKDKDQLPWKRKNSLQSKYTATEVWESEDSQFTCEHEFTSGRDAFMGLYVATVTITDNTIEGLLRDDWMEKMRKESQKKESAQAKETLDGL